MLASACQQFMGKSEHDIMRIAMETLEGHQRAIMGNMTVEVLVVDDSKDQCNTQCLWPRLFCHISACFLFLYTYCFLSLYAWQNGGKVTIIFWFFFARAFSLGIVRKIINSLVEVMSGMAESLFLLAITTFFRYWIGGSLHLWPVHVKVHLTL